ncbi:MFS-type transporter SLC18B1-like [Panonychus citri]|uniref:MFS-type transporter SLC18B1-like n=1 Tax=Panonychus citri TaxID=50023 RepID=UPI002307B970|nr:MFS-type transporter SLC18B1-like [Panonychus citri]
MLGFIDSADSHLMSTRSCGACSLHSSHRHALEEIRKVPISKRQILCLIALAYGNFCVAACVSLQAPFFPAECDNKGVSSQVYGLIFGIYELVILTASPIFGKMFAYVSPNFFLESGLFLAGITTVLFGILDRIADSLQFTVLAFSLRIFEGAGAAAFLTSCYTIMPLEFPDHISFLFALLETFFGLGLIVGPTVGGALFEVGGYITPFAVLGTCMILGSLVSIILLPKSGGVTQSKSPSVFAFLCDIGTLLDVLTIAGCLNLIGFNAATLEHHLRQFNLSPTKIGSIFIITGSVYALTNPLWGKLGEYKFDARWMSILGTAINIVGLLFMGPADFLPIEPQLWLVIVSLIIVGIGMAAKQVSAYIACLNDTINRRGYPNETSTYALVSATNFSSCSAGAFLGPSVGGYLLGTIGYRASTQVILGFEILTLILLVLYKLCGS